MVKIIRRGYETGYGGHGIFIPTAEQKLPTGEKIDNTPESKQKVNFIGAPRKLHTSTAQVQPTSELPTLLTAMLNFPHLPPPHVLVKSLIMNITGGK